MSKHPVIFPVLCINKPLQTTCNIFTDGSSNGKAAILTKNINDVILTGETFAQKAELRAIIAAFAMLADRKFNLFSDSQYMVRLFPHIETAVLPENKTTIFQLLSELQQQIWSRSKSFFVGHIRVHSKLPGPLHAYSGLADALTKPYIATALEKAKDSHALHHQNASALRCQFQIPREAAREMRACAHCPTTLPSLTFGVNPRGLLPNVLWQMDVTHIQSFGKLSFIHATVDTCSPAIVAIARTGEAFKDVVQHLFTCFSYLGIPKALKTDNALVYTSKPFKDSCARFNTAHSTGIPYNPQGQAIVERAHQTLETQITKLQEGEFKYSSPHHVLQHTLSMLNNLNTDL